MVEGIYVTARGSAAMESVEEIRTVEGCGIEGDRYCQNRFWTRYGDVCQVTLIEARISTISRTSSTSASRTASTGEHITRA